MSDSKLEAADYPLAENRPELVRGRRGKSLDDITMESVLSGDVTMEDLRITPRALRYQAQIARAAGRETLAANFERGAELAEIPQDVIMEVYECLRPGRAEDKAALLRQAARLRDEFGAQQTAAFVEEAAEVYDRRGLFKFRF